LGTMRGGGWGHECEAVTVRCSERDPQCGGKRGQRVGLC